MAQKAETRTVLKTVRLCDVLDTNVTAKLIIARRLQKMDDCSQPDPCAQFHANPFYPSDKDVAGRRPPIKSEPSFDLFQEINSTEGVKRTSQTHDDGHFTALCWVEIINLKEYRNGTNDVTKEYAILLESPGDVPGEYLEEDPARQREVVPYEIVDYDTKKSRVVNLTTVSRGDGVTVRENRKMMCASGPIYTKEFTEWPRSNKKRIEVRVSPRKKSSLAAKCRLKFTTTEIPDSTGQGSKVGDHQANVPHAQEFTTVFNLGDATTAKSSLIREDEQEIDGGTAGGTSEVAKSEPCNDGVCKTTNEGVTASSETTVGGGRFGENASSRTSDTSAPNKVTESSRTTVITPLALRRTSGLHRHTTPNEARTALDEGVRTSTGYYQTSPPSPATEIIVTLWNIPEASDLHRTTLSDDNFTNEASEEGSEENVVVSTTSKTYVSRQTAGESYSTSKPRSEKTHHTSVNERPAIYGMTNEISTASELPVTIVSNYGFTGKKDIENGAPSDSYHTVVPNTRKTQSPEHASTQTQHSTTEGVIITSESNRTPDKEGFETPKETTGADSYGSVVPNEVTRRSSTYTSLTSQSAPTVADNGFVSYNEATGKNGIVSTETTKTSDFYYTQVPNFVGTNIAESVVKEQTAAGKSTSTLMTQQGNERFSSGSTARGHSTGKHTTPVTSKYTAGEASEGTSTEAVSRRTYPTNSQFNHSSAASKSIPTSGYTIIGNDGNSETEQTQSQNGAPTFPDMNHFHETTIDLEAQPSFSNFVITGISTYPPRKMKAQKTTVTAQSRPDRLDIDSFCGTNKKHELLVKVNVVMEHRLVPEKGEVKVTPVMNMEKRVQFGLDPNSINKSETVTGLSVNEKWEQLVTELLGAKHSKGASPSTTKYDDLNGKTDAITVEEVSNYVEQLQKSLYSCDIYRTRKGSRVDNDKEESYKVNKGKSYLTPGVKMYGDLTGEGALYADGVLVNDYLIDEPSSAKYGEAANLAPQQRMFGPNSDGNNKNRSRVFTDVKRNHSTEEYIIEELIDQQPSDTSSKRIPAKPVKHVRKYKRIIIHGDDPKDSQVEEFTEVSGDGDDENYMEPENVIEVETIPPSFEAPTLAPPTDEAVASVKSELQPITYNKMLGENEKGFFVKVLDTLNILLRRLAT